MYSSPGPGCLSSPIASSMTVTVQIVFVQCCRQYNVVLLNYCRILNIGWKQHTVPTWAQHIINMSPLDTGVGGSPTTIPENFHGILVSQRSVEQPRVQRVVELRWGQLAVEQQLGQHWSWRRNDRWSLIGSILFFLMRIFIFFLFSVVLFFGRTESTS